MSNEPITEQSNSVAEIPSWQPAPPPSDLIFDDGEPLESNRHRIAMNVLIDSANAGLIQRGVSDFFAGGNMFVYYSDTQAMNRDFRGPDFFAVLDVNPHRERLGWVVWQEEGRYPDVIVELLSPTTAAVDRGIKKELYQRVFRTQAYYIYDPFDPTSFQGWQLNSTHQYEAIAADERGWLWCAPLQLWLGTWEGRIRREPATETCQWIRFYTAAGDLIPLPEDLAEQAQQRADQEQQRANQAQQRADQEQQRADQEQQRADQEQQRADQERQRAERLAERLRVLGEDPNLS